MIIPKEIINGMLIRLFLRNTLPKAMMASKQGKYYNN